MKKNNQGFTLLEVMIAVSIMAFISVFTAQTIQTAIKQKAKISKKINQNSLVRDVLLVMQQDIQKSFHYYDHHVEVYNLAQEERIKRKNKAKKKKTNPSKSDPSKSKTPPQGFGDNTGAFDDKTQKPNTEAEKFKKKEHKHITHFIGEEKSLHFTTLNNSRTRSQKNTSDQAEVGYYLKDCSQRGKPEIKSQCLWRRTSPIIDKDITEGGDATVLLENVEELKFQYTGPEKKNEWQSLWKSDQKGFGGLYNKFPSAVEITITMSTAHKGNKESKPITMSLVAPIRFPNNVVPKKKEEKTKAPNNAISN